MKVVKLYAKGGFVVINLLIDGEFEKVNPEISLRELNISVAHERVAEIEQYHRTFKERCRCVLPDIQPLGSNTYQHLHKKIVIRLFFLYHDDQCNTCGKGYL